jgi:hypothetical protein
MEKFLITHVPTVWLGIGSVVIVLCLAFAGLAVVRHSVELRKLQSQHEVAGFIIAVVGVIYAVLLAFVVVIQWEEFSSSQGTANTEATSIGNLFRDAVALGPAGRPLAAAVGNYAEKVAYREWPYVASHQEDDKSIDPALNLVWTAVSRTKSTSTAGESFVRKAVDDVSAATEARRTRVDDSSSTLLTPLWIVLLVGGALTIGFTFFFGLESFASQAAMMSTLAVLIALSLFVILVLDLPFSGDLAIKPDALQSEIAEFCSYDFVHPERGGRCASGFEQFAANAGRAAH